MHPTGGKAPNSNKSGGKSGNYRALALERIKQDLHRYEVQPNCNQLPQINLQNAINAGGHQSEQDVYNVDQYYAGGYTDKNGSRMYKPSSTSNGRSDLSSSDYLSKSGIDSNLLNGHCSKSMTQNLASKLMRKPSLERDLNPLQYHHRGSPALDSGAGSSRSDSPHSHSQAASQQISSRASLGYSPSPCPSSFSDAPPPLPPPRNSTTPPTPPPVVGSTNVNLQQILKRRSPATAARPIALPATSQSTGRGTSPVSPIAQQQPQNPINNQRQPPPPIIVQNGPKAQHQLTQQMQALNLYQSGGNSGEPPPPYPPGQQVSSQQPGPPSYSATIHNRQSPTQSQSDYRKSPSSGIYSATSAGSPSPLTIPQNAPTGGGSSTPVGPMRSQAWQAYKTCSQPPIIMQSVKSTQVQKPVLQTAVAPPPPPATTSSNASPVHGPPAPPSYASSVQQKGVNHQQSSTLLAAAATQQQHVTPPSTPPILNGNNGPSATPTLLPNTEPPSYAHTIQAMKKAAETVQIQQLPPPPPYQSTSNNNNNDYDNDNNDDNNNNNNNIYNDNNYNNNENNNNYNENSNITTNNNTDSDNRINNHMENKHNVNNNNNNINSSNSYNKNIVNTINNNYNNNHNDSSSTSNNNNKGNVNNNNLANSSSLPNKNNVEKPNDKSYNSKNNNTNNNNTNSNNNSNNKNTNSNNKNNNSFIVHNSNNIVNHKNVNHNNNNNNTNNNNKNTNKENCQQQSSGSSTSNKSDVNCKKIKHQSPIPERKKVSKEKEEERKEFRIKHYSPQAFKFFMEQHIENVLKSYKQRAYRKNQLEKEMMKINLSPQAQIQMRRMLNQKESNYIRLKRAKMDKSMFVQIKHIGVGAFGEVSLVRKIDTTNHLYAMKTLRKADVLKRNQVAHVKAERDILAEADNEWVVKLYYSFQDRDNLYFVMDYIPGGDLMSLLIKKGIFEEPLAKFYIAELTCAVESVHKMGFIHRDIKPDNILIDRDGHIKLTDFGLCTGFRWTHNSKYYQENGDHCRQDSMEPWEDFAESGRKPLERRRIRDHQRVLAHSLVGTPNYIAPEVLERSGYTQLCDWWSVGVILYEMLVGQPPFLANTPVETQHKVINWETTLSIPSQANLSRESSDLIKQLCSSSDKRLGKKADEVKQHEFFNEIDFNEMRKQKAPYIPKIEHPTDTSNFDPIDPDKLRSSTDSNGEFNDDTGKPFHGFFEFTFRRFFDDKLDKLNPDACDDSGPVYV